MRFTTSVDFTRFERKDLDKAFRVVGLLELNPEQEDERRAISAYRLIIEQGHSILEHQVKLALQTLIDLGAVVAEHAEYTLADYGFTPTGGPVMKVMKPVRSPGPLLRRVRGAEPMEVVRELPLVVNPPKFVAQMGDLRRGQLVDIERGLEILQEAVRRLQAMERLHRYIDEVQHGGPIDPEEEDYGGKG